MSRSLHARKVIHGEFVGEGPLIDMLSKKHGMFSHVTPYTDSWPLKLDCSDLEYITGLRDDGVDGAQRLLDLIEKYDSIEVYVQY
jgi:hypothetical protein